MRSLSINISPPKSRNKKNESFYYNVIRAITSSTSFNHRSNHTQKFSLLVKQKSVANDRNQLDTLVKDWNHLLPILIHYYTILWC
jgi:hypothetical protein